MSGQLFPALIAVMFGAVAGVILFVPFVAMQYRREGRLTLRQSLLWAGFLVYAIALWTYTLLPLPQTDSYACVTAQLRPFQFVADIVDNAEGAYGPRALLSNPAVMQVLLNIALFTPLGFFLRAVWRRGVVVTTITGFVISLAIETTQITGVWGIYLCGYRLFDVDDLIANTAGALLGGVLSIAIRHLVDRGDTSTAPTAPRPVTPWRRLLGALCDMLAVTLLGGVAGVGANLWQLLVMGVERTELSAEITTAVSTVVPLVVIGATVLASGRTIGDLAVLVRWEGGVRPRILARLLRYLAGIGGWQLLSVLLPGTDALLALASLVALFAARRRGGLPGIVSRMAPVDSRAGRGMRERQA